MRKSLVRLTILTLAVCGLAFVFGPQHGAAAINPQISFQGKLTNLDGTNVADGNYSIRFRIYTDPSADTGSCANTCDWEETHATVAVSGGVFHVNLGSGGSALPGGVDFNVSALYLGIKVGADTEMTPRVRLTASPQAFNSDMLDGLDSAAFGQLTNNQTWTNTNTYQPTANVSSMVVKQTSNAGATANIFNVQTANNTNIIQVTGPSPNNAAVIISSIGGSSGLTLQSGSGTVSLGTSTILTANGALTVRSTGTNAFTLDTGGAAALNIGNTNATSIVVGNGTTNPSISFSGSGTLGTGTGAISLNGNTTVTGTRTLSVSGGLTTLSAGVTVVGTAQVNASGTAATTIGNSSGGAVGIVGGAASSFTTAVGGITIQAAGTSTVSINTAGAGTLDLGNTNTTTINLGGTAGSTITIGGGNVAHTVNIAAAGSSTNQIVTVGSTNSGSTTLIQGGTSLTLRSGGNIVLGTSDTTATLLVLDTKTSAGDPTAVAGSMYYNSSNNKFRCAQSSTWYNCTNEFNTVTKTADQAATQSSTTFQNDNTLVFPVAANTTYVFDAWIPVNDSNTTADLKYTFTTPASSTLNIMTLYYSSATANVLCNIVTSGQTCANTTVNLANHFIQVRGHVAVAGTAGNVQFQFAQNGSTAASFPVVKKGATLTWHQSN